MLKDETQAAIATWALRSQRGVTAMVDGQYGSTGKGLLASAIGEAVPDHFPVVLTNAGPNSGHTFYVKDDEPVALKQLPVYPCMALSTTCWPKHKRVILTGGAVLDISTLRDEIAMFPGIECLVHQTAAVITEAARKEDRATMGQIASTGKGVGPSIARKISRTDAWSVAESWGNVLEGIAEVTDVRPLAWDAAMSGPVFMEVSQGFSLGLNQPFYPHVTSRECTVSQAMADACLPPQALSQTAMSVRTFPIRVGNTETGYSGDWYPDQEETTWEDIGVAPEYTTVTKRMRRVATWSARQYEEALKANRPSAIFVNFCNYLAPNAIDEFLDTKILRPYYELFGQRPWMVLLGYGPRTSDIELWR